MFVESMVQVIVCHEQQRLTLIAFSDMPTVDFLTVVYDYLHITSQKSRLCALLVDPMAWLFDNKTLAENGVRNGSCIQVVIV